jgi:uncharacterized protein YjiS (DUF1127 family)
MLLSVILAKLQRALEARKAVRLLATYSDRELADLGLTRDQIGTAVHGRFGSIPGPFR